MDLNMFSTLRVDDWRRAKADADKTIRQANEQPQLAHYIKADAGRYPTWLIAASLALLLVVAIGSLVVSAGKQLIATNMVLADLVHYGQVDENWVHAALAVTLLLGEVGALTFSLASALFDGKLVQVIFRVVAFVCAAFAILANLTIFALDIHQEAWLYQFVLTVVPPALVLAVGYFGEKLLLEHLERRAAALRPYHEAMTRYQQVAALPALHPDYARVFNQSVLRELRERQPNSVKGRFDQTLAADPTVARLLLAREKLLHETGVSLEFDAERPTLPSATGAERSNGFHGQSKN